MKKGVFKLLRKEEGVSLVGVVASVVLLAIILLSSYYMFVQSAKTTKSSEDIIEATYIAQTEMEKLYILAKGESIPKDFKSKVFPGYGVGIKNGNGINEYCFENVSQTDVYKILTVKVIESNLTRVLIQVFDEKGGKLKAQMETTFEWRP